MSKRGIGIIMSKEDISKFTNEDLLDELIRSYNHAQDMINRVDYVKWSKQAEREAVDYYGDLFAEALYRMSD